MGKFLDWVDDVSHVSEDKVAGFVFGNGSADIDSIVSAIALAYMLSQLVPTLFYPVINIPRDYLVFRFEQCHVLGSMFGISDEEAAKGLKFLFADSPDLIKYLKNPKNDYMVALVDHNVLSFENSKLWGEDVLKDVASRVKFIVDHHESDTHEPVKPEAARAAIEEWGADPNLNFTLYGATNIGSCTSEISLMYKYSKLDLPVRLARGLLSGIVRDTKNLKKSIIYDRWDPAVDKVAYDYLLKICAKCDAKTIEEELKKIRDDESRYAQLSVEQLLLIDAKLQKYNGVGGIIYYATLPFPLERLEGVAENLNNLEKALIEFQEKGEYRGMILTSSDTKTLPRQLMLFSTHEDVLNQLVEVAEEQSLFLELDRRFEKSTIYARFYDQYNAQISRKKLEPLFRHRLN